MAIALDTTGDGAKDLGNNGGSGTLTASFNSGTGSNVILWVSIEGDSTSDNITGVTYSGVNMSRACRQAPNGSETRWLYLYYLQGPASGSNNVQITTSSGYIIANAACYTGAAQSGLDNSTTNPGTGGTLTTLTTSLTPVASNCWTIMAASSYSAITNDPTAGTGSTKRAHDAAFGTMGIFDSNGAVTGGSSYSMTALWVSQPPQNQGIVAVMASFAPASGGATTTGSAGIGASQTHIASSLYHAAAHVSSSASKVASSLYAASAHITATQTHIASSLYSAAGHIASQAAKVASSIKSVTAHLSASSVEVVTHNLIAINEHLSAIATILASSKYAGEAGIHAASAQSVNGHTVAITEHLAAIATEIASSLKGRSAASGAFATVLVTGNLAHGSAHCGASVIVSIVGSVGPPVLFLAAYNNNFLQVSVSPPSTLITVPVYYNGPD